MNIVCKDNIWNRFQVIGEQEKPQKWHMNMGVIVLLVTHIVMVVGSTLRKKASQVNSLDDLRVTH